MVPIENLVYKYFYTSDGELAPGGTALITTGILALCGAIGAGSIKLGSMVWNRCTRPSARVPAVPVPNADPDARNRLGTTKLYEFLSSPTGSRLAAITGVFGACVFGKAYGEGYRANLNCKGTDWCTTVECCIGTAIAIGSTGTLVALGAGTALGLLLKPWYDEVKNQPGNLVAAPIRAVEEGVNRISEALVDTIPPVYRPFTGRARNVQAARALFRGAVLGTIGGSIGAGIALGAAITPTHAASARKRFFPPTRLMIPEDVNSSIVMNQ